MTESRISCRLAISLLLISANVAMAETHWPRFRGPLGTGHSAEKGLPVSWSDDEIVWRTELPGIGQSSPTIWDDRIYLTSARQTEAGDVERLVMCIRRSDGSILWQHAATQAAAESTHKMNSWATPSCATNGERVVAFFGAGGMHCFDKEGKKLWSRNLGSFPGPWGTAASPIIIGGAVIQNCDAAGESFLAALDLETGEDVWRTSRGEMPRGGWSTPILIDAGGRRELVLNGQYGVHAYDPQSGKELWFCKGFSGRGTPMPDYADGLLYVVNGRPGDMFAVKPGGAGEVAATHMAWHTPRRKGRDLPSPAFVDGFVIVVSMGGVITGYEASSGRELWNGRLGGNFSASPLIAGGLLYIPNEAGEVFVIKPGKTFELVARNKLPMMADDEIVRSSITPADGRLLIRSNQALYCVGNP